MQRYVEAQAVYEHATAVLAPDALNRCYRQIAGEIDARLAGTNPVVISVMVGGLVPTVRVTECLAFGFELDYLHATRYGTGIDGGPLVWKVSPQIDLADRHVLIIDDIIDEGHTLAAIQSAIRGQSPASLTTAVVLDKQHDRRVADATVDITGAEIPDRFVFGGGMDYRGYFRQLPGIWAVSSDQVT